MSRMGHAMETCRSTRTCCVSPSCRLLEKRPCAMSLETDIKIGSLERGRVRYFPVVPGRVEFAAALRRLLLAEKPQIVAVELPGFLESAYRRALQRLPEMSVILCTPSTSESDDEDDRPVYVPVEPADPFTEAVRTAD